MYNKHDFDSPVMLYVNAAAVCRVHARPSSYGQLMVNPSNEIYESSKKDVEVIYIVFRSLIPHTRDLHSSRKCGTL